MNPSPGTHAWLDQVKEDILEPGRPIIDPHHHLWPEGHLGLRQYLLAELWRDTGSGHKIERTVFLECGMGYRASGPEHLKPVGETAFINRVVQRGGCWNGNDGGEVSLPGSLASLALRVSLPSEPSIV